MDGHSPSIVVVGSINADLVAEVVRLPAPGETILAKGVTTIPGGKGANQAVAAARLGADVVMLGRVGDDAFASMLLESLEAAGVKTGQIESVKGVSSGVAMIQVDAEGENVITVASGANAFLRAEDVRAMNSAFAACDAVVAQLETPLESVAEAINQAHRAGIPVILDPAPAPSGELPERLYHVSVLTPNQTEAETLTGCRVTDRASAEKAARRLLDRGAERVVMKLGADGALVVEPTGKGLHIPAPSVAVVDTTAAGDAFTAAMAVELARGVPLDDAVRLACSAGALAVTQRGAQPAMPTREQVVALMKRGSGENQS